MGWIIGGIVLLILVMLVVIYNRLVTLRQRLKNAWAQIEVQLKRRYDLIPNLVATVKGYAAHEKETLERVTEARSMAMNAKNVQEQAGAENALTGPCGSYLPGRKLPSPGQHQLPAAQEELSNTEQDCFSRFHNDTVLKYNTAIQKFPAVMAGMFGFHRMITDLAEEVKPAGR